MEKQGEVKENREKKRHIKKYYVCQNCGYVTIIRNSFCPICAKDGLEIKMK